MADQANPASMLDELRTIRNQLKEQELQLHYVQEYQKILTDLHDLKSSVDQKWTQVKMLTAVGTAFLSLVGLFGFKSLNDVQRRANERIEKAVTESNEKIDQNVKESKEFYDDLMAGSAHQARKEYAASVQSLLKCFKGHTYDKSVVIPLLTALDVEDDWANALPVIAKLRSDPVKFGELNDAAVYTGVASIEVQSGLTELGPVYDLKDEAAKRMESGFALLRRASAIPTNDEETRRLILTNYWIYYIARRDFTKAKEMIDSLEQQPPSVRAWSWKHMNGFKCMQALARQDRSGATVSTAAQQWSRLNARYLPN